MSEHVVAHVDDLADGDRIIVEVEGREVGIFRHEGAYVAYLNWCPHQGAPVCQGPLSGTVEGQFDKDTLTYEEHWVKVGEILVCPWHNWEFDLNSGDCISNSRYELPQYDVWEEDGRIMLNL